MHCQNLAMASTVFEYFVKIICLPYEDTSFSLDVEVVKKSGEVEEVEDDDDDEDEKPLELCGLMKGSPYYQHFENLKNEIIAKAQPTNNANVFYSKDF